VSDYHYDESMEKIEEARRHVNRAMQAIFEVTTHDDPGVSKDYLKQLEKALRKLSKAKQVLSP
jgi:hypothetical protein